MNVFVCLSVCLSVWRRGDTWRTVGFTDDVVVELNRPYGGMPLPLQRVTPLRRRAQDNVRAE